MKTFLLIFLFLLSSSLSAKDWSAYKNQLKARTEGILSPRIQKRIVRSQQLMTQDNYKKAFEILEKIANKPNASKYERSRILYTLSFAYAQKEKYVKARKALETILKLDAFPLKQTLQCIFALAQFRALNNDIDGAKKLMDQWFALSDTPQPAAYIFMANLMYQKKNNTKALEMVLKGISLTSKPQESWLAFAVSLLYMQNRYKEATTWLYKLLEIKINKKTYWKQLAASLLSTEQHMHALAVLKLAMGLNLLKEEGEILNIASLYLSNDMPFEASQIMQFGIKQEKLKSNRKNFEFLANALIHAKEYQAALGPLEQAAQLSKDGKLYALKARLLLEQGKYKMALDNFNNAVKKGLTENGTGRVLLEKGITLIQIGELQKASVAIDKATTYKSVAKAAKNWQRYLQHQLL